jgi:type I restriction enzyme S subunit
MKEGWQTIKLGDLLEVQNGYAFDSKAFDSSQGMPLIRIRDLKGGSKTEARFTGDYDNKYVVKTGDLLIGMDGEFGCYEWKGSPALLNQRVCRLQGFTSALLPRFLFYGVNSHLKAIEEVTGFATVKHLSSKQILGIEFPFPPLPEQQRIVGILDRALEGIATAKANAEKNIQNACSLFESHLQAVFAEVWQTCKLVTLSDLATDITDGSHLPPPKSLTGVPFITIGNIVKDTRKIDFSNTFMVPHAYFYGLKQNKKPRRGDLLYTVTGSFGIPVIVDDDVEFCFQRHIGLIRPKPGTNSSWLYYLLLSPQVFNQANERATGTAQKTVSLRALRCFAIPNVPLPQQSAAVATLDALSEETQRLESLYQKKLASLNELKKSLLQQAFNGQL